MLSQQSPIRDEENRSSNLGAVTERILTEHRRLAELLESVERAANATRSRQPKAIGRLDDAIWHLYIDFEEHLRFEERELGPLLEASAFRDMIIEHNEQRDALLHAVEDSQSDVRAAADLAAEAVALVVRFRADIVLEERGLAQYSVRAGRLQPAVTPSSRTPT